MESHPLPATDLMRKKKQSKVDKSWLLVSGQPFQSRLWQRREGGEAVSKTFPKAFQNIPSPRQQLFSFNLQTSAWSTWLSCYCQIIQTFPISPNPPGSMITKAFWQTYWLIFFHYQLQPPESLNKCSTKHQDRGASSLTNTLKKVTLFHFLFNMGSVETCNINK